MACLAHVLLGACSHHDSRWDCTAVMRDVLQGTRREQPLSQFPASGTGTPVGGRADGQGCGRYLCDLHSQAMVFGLQALEAGCACLVHAGDRGGCFRIFFLLILSELEASVLSRCIWICSQSDKLKEHGRV